MPEQSVGVAIELFQSLFKFLQLMLHRSYDSLGLAMSRESLLFELERLHLVLVS